MAKINDDYLKKAAAISEEELAAKEREFFATFTKKLPVYFLVDGTLAMKEKSAELNAGINHFLELIAGDKLTKETVDLAVMTFNDKIEVVRPLRRIKEVEKVMLPALKEGGAFTLKLANFLDVLKEAHELYIQEDILYPQGWLFIFTNTPFNGPGYLEFQHKVFVEGFSTTFQTVVFSYSSAAEVDLFGSVRPLGSNFIKEGQTSELFAWLAANLKRFAHDKGTRDDELIFTEDAVKLWRE